MEAFMKSFKLLVATVAMTLVASSLGLAAQVTGRALMRVVPELGRGDQHFIEIREQDGNIYGSTFAGRTSMVSLSSKNGRWSGSVGGATNFSDSSAGADGFV